jgi:hypothetical protein
MMPLESPLPGLAANPRAQGVFCASGYKHREYPVERKTESENPAYG